MELGSTARPAHPFPRRMAGAVGGGDNGEASGLCFFIFFCNDQMAGAAIGEALAFFYFFCNVCRASISTHGNFLMDFEILCRAPKLRTAKLCRA
jgi:hypothetical protein